ncbi:MAG: ComEC/Rec2 family competence protein, partial [Acidimicrobiia bacterium]|nr:ComEC/Rec2 family competence protein [Acidimicrobiia bacterium]
MIGVAAVCWLAVAVGLGLGLVDRGPVLDLSSGRGVFEATAASDPVPGRFDTRLLVRLDATGGEVVARFAQAPDVSAGDLVVVSGTLRAEPGSFRGRPVAGELAGAVVLSSSPPPAPFRRAANTARSRVIDGLKPDASPARALLAGFLVGDTSRLPRIETDSLRRAGLSHFVAVSGSNVALFLAGWWLVFAPLAMIPQLRWALGILGLAFFVVVTRGEPSVIRAAVMAGISLVGRAAGLLMDSWTVLSLSVVGCLVVIPRFALDV